MIHPYVYKTLLLFVLLSPAGTLPAQTTPTKNPDSLFAIWSDTTNTPETRVEAYYQRFNPMASEVNNPEAVRWAPGLIEVQQLARQTGKTEYMGRFQLLESGYYFFFTDQQENGCQLAKEAFYTAVELEDYPGNYHLILMDVQMPLMNGYEATARIRALANGQATIPIIAMTANVMKEEIDHCYEVGMNDFIGKPFDTEELLQKMAALLRPI